MFLDNSRIGSIEDVQNWHGTLRIELSDEISRTPEKDYQKILDCKAQKLILKTRLNTSTFEYPGILPKRDTLILTNSYWFTSNHLMESDYKHLEVEGSNLTNRDLNQFIKQWVMGGKENLKVLAIDTNEEIDLGVVCDGFQDKCHRLPEEQDLEYMSPIIEITSMKNAELYIKRDDGTLATVYSSTIRNKLVFVVCPDYRGHTI